MNEHKNVILAPATISNRLGDDGFRRTAIIVPNHPEQATSIDVVTTDGHLLCRLNIFAKPDRSWGDVDVILDPESQSGTFIAWRAGEQIACEPLPGVSVYAVNIASKSQQPEGGFSYVEEGTSGASEEGFVKRR